MIGGLVGLAAGAVIGNKIVGAEKSISGSIKRTAQNLNKFYKKKAKFQKKKPVMDKPMKAPAKVPTPKTQTVGSASVAKDKFIEGMKRGLGL